MTPCVVFQVSQPYSSTDLTFELKSLIFVEIEILDAFHTLLRLAKAVLAFPPYDNAEEQIGADIGQKA